MKLDSNVESIADELQALVDFFEVEGSVRHIETISEGNICQRFLINDKEFNFHFILSAQNPRERKSEYKRKVKACLYEAMTKNFKKELPWGALTGIRPTKLARDLIEKGAKEFLIDEILEKDYFVSKDKAKLVMNIIKNQRCIIRNDNLVDLYLNIPVCPSRCCYCSFISSEYDKVKTQIDEYITCMIKELNLVKEIIREKALIVRSIYIGGGTPSVLSCEQLDRLLEEISFPVSEFTVECGRADTINGEKLDVLKKHGVTRISINPQTFCESTLKRIGRSHKNAQVFSAYEEAIKRNFVVNMDVIAGLPKEKLGIFKRTIQTLLDLNPENITVHALSVKKGSVLIGEQIDISSQEAKKMVEYAQKALVMKGYKPYYLYRQKHQLGGLENVGYFRDKYVCIFNIDSMEETNTIFAVGANAMSKRVFNIENRIERLANPKFLGDYIARIDEIIKKKKEFFN